MEHHRGLRLLPESRKARPGKCLSLRQGTFDKKPEFSTTEKAVIISFTRPDILALSELNEKDLSKQLKIKKFKRSNDG